MCGADGDMLTKKFFTDGSSPRVRGRRCCSTVLVWGGGLIPACAGQTRFEPADTLGNGAHPRVCGADMDTVPIFTPMSGSSPRVRGRQMMALGDTGTGGLIPACAGQTR